jgi:hypothetical protein
MFFCQFFFHEVDSFLHLESSGVHVVSLELKIYAMLEKFWIVTDKHGSNDQGIRCEEEGRGINLHFLGLLSVWVIQISFQVLNDQESQYGWISELDHDAEVSLEGKHPPGSGAISIGQ